MDVVLSNPTDVVAFYKDYLIGVNSVNGDKFVEEHNARMKALNEVYHYAVSGFVSEDGKDDKADVFDLRSAVNGKYEKSGKVAVIPLVGSMTKNTQYSWWGGVTRGTSAIAADIRAANADPDITGIVMYVDSPGGSVDGTHLLSEEIKKSAKPIVAVVSGMCCSAAMWAVAHAYKIYTTAPQDYVGSIGVYTMHTDYSKYFEQIGISIKTITATGSTEKVIGSPYEPLAPEHEQKIRSQLDEVRSDFISVVKAGRKDNLTDSGDSSPIWTGTVFHTKQARSLGIIDGMRSMDAVVLEAHRAGSKAMRENSSNRNNSKSMSNSTMFDKYLADEKKVATEPQVLSAETANLLSQKLDNALESAETANAKVAELQAELDSAKAEKETLSADLQAEKEKVKTLEANQSTGNEAELIAENEALKLKVNGVQAVEADAEKGIEAVEAVEGLEAKSARLETELESAKTESAALKAEVESLKQFKTETIKAYNDLVGKYNSTAAGKEKQAAKMDEAGKVEQEQPGQSGQRLTFAEFTKLSS